MLILGGGYAGLAAARVFGKYPKTLSRAGLAPVVVDRVEHHVYTPLLYEVASGCVGAHGAAAGLELAQGVSLHFDRVLQDCCRVGYIHGEISGIDVAQRIVTLQNGTRLPYAYLLLALGSETDYYGIPGLQHHAYALKTRAQALLIRQRIQEFIDRKQRREEVQIQIMVGGGGATGVEFSAEMASCFRRLVREGKLADGDWSLTLVEASPRLLGMLAPEVSAHALARLTSLGVKVLRDTCIKRADHGGVVLAPRPLKPGEPAESLVCDFRTEVEKVFEADVLVWTGGVRAPDITKSLGLPLDPKGRLLVDPTFAVPGAKGLYAVGDVSSLTDPATKRAVPQLAQAAIEEAELAARNILAAMQGRSGKNYHHHSFPASIPLGGKNAVTVFANGVVVRGFVGWLIRQLADLRYFMRVFPFGLALRFFFSGTRAYLHND